MSEKTKLNIAFLTKEYNTSTVDAGFTTLVCLAKELKKMGHTVVMISGRQKYVKGDILPADKKIEIFEGIPIFRPYRLPWFRVNRWFFDPSNMFNKILAAPLGLRYVQKSRHIQFDVIHSFSSSPALALNSIFAGFFSRKAILAHSIKSESGLITLPFGLETILYHLLNLVHGVVLPLSIMKELLICKGSNAEKMRVIHAPIELFKFVKKNKSTLRKKYGFDAEMKLVLYYGNRVSSKGVDILIDALDFIPEKENIKILMVFPTSCNKNDLRIIKNKRNKDKIRISAEKIEVADYLSMADLVVLPYKHLIATEANPLCLLEAMACKTPVLTTDIPEIRELVRDKKDVLMAEPNNPKDLAEKMLFLLNNLQLQKNLVKNAYNTVKKFDSRIIAKQYVKLYTDLLNRRGI